MALYIQKGDDGPFTQVFREYHTSVVGGKRNRGNSEKQTGEANLLRSIEGNELYLVVPSSVLLMREVGDPPAIVAEDRIGIGMGVLGEIAFSTGFSVNEN
jgi:hypothetical protein